MKAIALYLIFGSIFLILGCEGGEESFGTSRISGKALTQEGSPAEHARVRVQLLGGDYENAPVLSEAYATASYDGSYSVEIGGARGATKYIRVILEKEGFEPGRSGIMKVRIGDPLSVPELRLGPKYALINLVCNLSSIRKDDIANIPREIVFSFFETNGVGATITQVTGNYGESMDVSIRIPPNSKRTWVDPIYTPMILWDHAPEGSPTKYYRYFYGIDDNGHDVRLEWVIFVDKTGPRQ